MGTPMNCFICSGIVMVHTVQFGSRKASHLACSNETAVGSDPHKQLWRLRNRCYCCGHNLILQGSNGANGPEEIWFCINTCCATISTTVHPRGVPLRGKHDPVS